MDDARRTPGRDFRAEYRALLESRHQPLIGARFGRFVGDLLDEVDRLRDANSDMLAAATNLLAWAEYAEVQIDSEWGSARSLDRIVADGELPPEIAAMRASIARATAIEDGRASKPC